jgi:hypothetical protein
MTTYQRTLAIYQTGNKAAAYRLYTQDITNVGASFKAFCEGMDKILVRKEISPTDAMISYTNNRIANWYTNAKLDYGVIGKGTCKVEGNSFIVNYTENGEEKVWEMPFYPEYVTENKISYFFDCWMELS